MINEDALAFIRRSGLEASVCERLRRPPCKTFAGEHAWLMRLDGLSVDVFARTLVRTLTEGALREAVRAQGVMRDTVVVSDAAGQFRAARHALCRVHSERLIRKLKPATARLEKAVKTVPLEIALHTNASQNDPRACGAKRKISGGTIGADGRQPREVMLGLMKKLDLSVFVYLGARVGYGDPADSPAPLADLVAGAAA